MTSSRPDATIVPRRGAVHSNYILHGDFLRFLNTHLVKNVRMYSTEINGMKGFLMMNSGAVLDRVVK